eukprot:212980-Prorocentrum_minimum.AAC.9
MSSAVQAAVREALEDDKRQLGERLAEVEARASQVEAAAAAAEHQLGVLRGDLLSTNAEKEDARILVTRTSGEVARMHEDLVRALEERARFEAHVAELAPLVERVRELEGLLTETLAKSEADHTLLSTKARAEAEKVETERLERKREAGRAATTEAALEKATEQVRES